MNSPGAARFGEPSSTRRSPGLGALGRRLGERDFWIVQAGVGLVTILHVGSEVPGPWHDLAATLALHHVPVALYVLPIVYAGYRYGMEGTALTGVWCGLLTVPNILLWHREGFMWLGEAGYVAVVLMIGMLVAVPVEREKRQRQQAESTSRKLALVHEVSEGLYATDEVDATVAIVLKKLAESAGLKGAWARLWSERDDGRGARVLSEPHDLRVPAAVLAVGSDALALEEVTLVSDRLALAPLRSESALAGILSIISEDDRTLGPDDLELLGAVAGQMDAAVENCRLRRLERERLRSYVLQVTRALEEERKRIARELHDDVAQTLVLLRRGLEALGSDPEEDGLRLIDLKRKSQDAISTVRRLSRDLRPTMLDDLGLIPALEWLTSELTNRTGVKADLHVNGTPARLSPGVEVSVFRMVQEALRNVEWHASASSVTVEASFDPSAVRVTVRDDGCGFTLSNGGHGSVDLTKLGILGMQERAKLVGGELSVRSERGEGTSVHLRVPVT